ncbi:MAG: hypothetical protein PHS62_04005 [Patescibacteria group bacterium]|nr:hypothetical protein [Patescibacteria group bacterium]
MMQEIKKIDRKSLARITALIYGLVGFFMALAVAASTAINIILKNNFQGSIILVTLFNIGLGLLVGVLTALLTALLGWIIGFITAGIYNWFVKKVGGIKVELGEAGGTKVEAEKNQPVILK